MYPPPTGTLALAASAGALTEIQAGSYVFSDAAYWRLQLGFEPALFCLATVIGRRDERIALVDAGLKTLAVDQGFPLPPARGAEVTKASDEHLVLSTAQEWRPRVGDRLLLMPGHLDPTINLHDALFARLADDTIELWPVDGRQPHASRASARRAPYRVRPVLGRGALRSRLGGRAHSDTRLHHVARARRLPESGVVGVGPSGGRRLA